MPYENFCPLLLPRLPALGPAQHRFDYQWPFGYGPSLPDGFGMVVAKHTYFYEFGN